MAAFFTQSQPKVRQEGFDTPTTHHPPSPSTTPSGPFDTSMFFGHHIFNGSNPAAAAAAAAHAAAVDHHLPHSYKAHGDFGDEIAAMMGEAAGGPASPAPPHNPFDTNGTVSYHRTHNIFDVSSTSGSATTAASFPAHFSLPTHSHSHSHSSHFDTTPSYHDYRTSSRSRSRSKLDSSAAGGRVSSSRKRGSISSTSPRPHSPAAAHLSHSHSRPQAILIPPTTNGHTHHGGGHPVSPLSLHMHAQTAPSAWFMDSPFRGGDSFRTADSPFSLPTPDSISVHHPFSGPGSLPTNTGTSPKSVSAKESPPPSGGPAVDAAAKQAQLASEKRRRRRESHNAVERRRRDNINEKISELATLIPECMLDPNSGTGADAADPFSPDAEERKDSVSATGAGGSAPVKANKGMILRKSVEYIRYLQQLVNAQATRNRELEAQLASTASPTTNHHAHLHAINGTSLSLMGASPARDTPVSTDGGGGGVPPGLTHGLTDSESPASMNMKVVEEGEGDLMVMEHEQEGDGDGENEEEGEGEGEEDEEMGEGGEGDGEERGRRRERGGVEKVRVKREEEGVGMEE